MARSDTFVIRVAILAAITIPIRELFAFPYVRSLLTPPTIEFISRVGVFFVAVVGIALIGYLYGRTEPDDDPVQVYAFALLGTFAGVLVGTIFVGGAVDTYWERSLVTSLLRSGIFAIIDAAMLAMFALGGFAAAARHHLPLDS